MSNPKEIRKQIRNVLQEEGGSEAIKIAVEQCDKLIADKLAAVERSCLARLEEIAKASNEQLESIDKRSKAIQGYLVGQVKNDIQQMISKNEDAIDAMVELLAEAGVGVPNLPALVAARIPIIREAKSKAAGEALQKRLEAERASNDQASAQ